MRDIPAIIYTETDRKQIQRVTEDALYAMRFAEQREEKTVEKAQAAVFTADKAREVAARAKQEADRMRLEAGRALKAEREQWPARGPKAKGWGQRIVELGLDQRTAHRLMALAGFVDEVSDSASGESESPLPTQREVAESRRSNAIATTSEDFGELAAEIRDGQASEAEPQHVAPSSSVAERSGGRGKPQWLMRALVRDYSMPGDLVCDPLAGWGSTLRAALDEGRRAIGAEIDPAVIAEAGSLPIRAGAWQVALDGVDCDAVICDPPYSARTHEASRKFGNAREDGSSLAGLGPDYAAWTRDHVFEFVRSWAPRNRGWFVALTDHNLIRDWQDAYEDVGLYSFAPVICLIRGMTVRLCGDGPSSWAIYAMVARPVTASRWRTLTGGYVGSRDRLEIGDAA